MSEPKAKFVTFSVGLPPEVNDMRRRVEDRIARLCFKKRDRFGVPTYVMWEKIISALDLTTDEDLRRLFYDGGA